jgi:hypothetical protein
MSIRPAGGWKNDPKCDHWRERGVGTGRQSGSWDIFRRCLGIICNMSQLSKNKAICKKWSSFTCTCRFPSKRIRAAINMSNEEDIENIRAATSLTSRSRGSGLYTGHVTKLCTVHETGLYVGHIAGFFTDHLTCHNAGLVPFLTDL